MYGVTPIPDADSVAYNKPGCSALTLPLQHSNCHPHIASLQTNNFRKMVVLFYPTPHLTHSWSDQLSVWHLQEPLESLVSKIAEGCIWQHLQHVGQDACIEAPDAFLLC